MLLAAACVRDACARRFELGCAQQHAAALVPWALLLGAFAAAGLGSASMFAVGCAFGVAGQLLLRVTRPPPARALALAAACFLLPVAFVCETINLLLDVLIPITGRAGVVIPGDLLVAVIIAAPSALCSGPVCAPVHAARQSGGLRRALLLGGAAAACIALGWNTRFTPEHPKRLIVQHVARERNGEPLDAGVWLSAFDPSGLHALRGLGIPAVDHQRPHECALDTPSTGCYLSLPYYFALGDVVGVPDGRNSVFAHRLPASHDSLRKVAPPAVPADERLAVRLVEATAVPGGRRLVLSVRGPSHMALAIADEQRLRAWSLSPGVPPARRPPLAPQERVTFAFFSAGGHGPRTWDMWLEFNGSQVRGRSCLGPRPAAALTPRLNRARAQPVDLSVYAHYLSAWHTEELDLLAAAVPASARGDWHWHSSALSRWTF